MAEAKKLTLADILAKRKEFEDMVAAQLKAERPAALAGVLELNRPGFGGGSNS